MNIDYINNHFPKLPVFFYGLSLGGLITLKYITEMNPKISGAVISAPVLDIAQPVSPIKKVLAKALNNFLPGLILESDLKRL